MTTNPKHQKEVIYIEKSGRSGGGTGRQKSVLEQQQQKMLKRKKKNLGMGWNNATDINTVLHQTPTPGQSIVDVMHSYNKHTVVSLFLPMTVLKAHRTQATSPAGSVTLGQCYTGAAGNRPSGWLLACLRLSCVEMLPAHPSDGPPASFNTTEEECTRPVFVLMIHFSDSQKQMLVGGKGVESSSTPTVRLSNPTQAPQGAEGATPAATS